MKKAISIILCLVIVVSFASCGKNTDTGNTDHGDTGSEKAIISVHQDEYLYKCSVCAGDCTFYSGQFNCPAFNCDGEDAVQLNAEIEAEYNEYLADAELAADSDSGLAYGFTYSVYEDDAFAVVRTASATVMLHSGGMYAYEMYYYDLKNDCKTTAVALMNHLSLDPVVIAAYVRVLLIEEGKYTEEQISSVQPNDIDIFPTQTAYFIKVKNEQIKFETELDGMDLNDAAGEIAEVLPFIEREPVSEQVVGTEVATQEPTTQQRDIIMYEIVPDTTQNNSVG